MFTLRTRVKRFLRFCLRASAVAYPLALAAVTVALATVGERWWPTTVGLYVPRVLFGLPLPLLVLALLVWGPRWMLLLQLVAAAVLVFPLMGLSLARPHPAPAGAATLRVLTYNIDFGFEERRAVIAEIVAADPDVIALQAFDQRIVGPLAAALPGRHTHRFDEFFVSSRYPIVDAYHPPALADETACGFVRVTVDSPLGLVDVYVTHPVSPRRGFEAIRGRNGLRHGLASGEAFSEAGPRRVARNTDVRIRQVEALAAHARAATHPVIIAGDTNLPGLSPLFRRELGDFKDGWREVGAGFGYTFPAHRWMPWLRIDRILAGKGLRFVDFTVGDRRGSDHLGVWATLCAD